MTSYYEAIGLLAICGQTANKEPVHSVHKPTRAKKRTPFHDYSPYPTFRYTPPLHQRPNQHPYLTHQPAHYTPHGITASGPAPGPGGGIGGPPPMGGPAPTAGAPGGPAGPPPQAPVAAQSPLVHHVGPPQGAQMHVGTPVSASGASISPAPHVTPQSAHRQLPRPPQPSQGTPGAGFPAEGAVVAGLARYPPGSPEQPIQPRGTPSPNMRSMSMTPRRDSLPGTTSSGSVTPRSRHKSGRVSTTMHPDPKQQYKTEECNICGRPFKGPKASTHKQQHIRRLHPESYMPKRGGKKKADREMSAESMPPSQSQSPQQMGSSTFYPGDLANVANAAMAMQYPQ